MVVGIEVDIEAENLFSTSGTGGGGEEQGEDRAYVIRGNPKTYADSDTSFQDDETVCGRNNGTAKLNNKTEKHGVRCCGDGQTAVEENGGTWKQSSGGGSNSCATKLLCDGAGGGCDNYCIWTANEGQDEEGVGEEGDSADNESTEAPPAASGDDGSADNESTEAPPTASGDDGSADNETSTEAPPAASGDEAETSGEASSSTGIVIGVLLAVVVLGGVVAALAIGCGGGGGGGEGAEGDETEDDSGEGEGGDEGDDLSDLKNRGS
eukprot:g5312.t1